MKVFDTTWKEPTTTYVFDNNTWKIPEKIYTFNSNNWINTNPTTPTLNLRLEFSQNVTIFDSPTLSSQSNVISSTYTGGSDSRQSFNPWWYGRSDGHTGSWVFMQSSTSQLGYIYGKTGNTFTLESLSEAFDINGTLELKFTQSITDYLTQWQPQNTFILNNICPSSVDLTIYDNDTNALILSKSVNTTSGSAGTTSFNSWMSGIMAGVCPPPDGSGTNQCGHYNMIRNAQISYNSIDILSL
tara:strand:- start:4607 stop:5332 length:726 start_codon:yes stop_codon:yes gene_type:complete